MPKIYDNGDDFAKALNEQELDDVCMDRTMGENTSMNYFEAYKKCFC
ncbi:MAG: hypothetical protein LBV52_02550 [Spirochaetaceae bacterium]|jgi:hypothetical protein|nr:hypothetical protein [Spirochaetaceae bacterium]